MRRLLAILTIALLVPTLAACGKKHESKAKTTGSSGLSQAPTVTAGSGPAPTTLQKTDITVGTGATAVATSTVKVQYVGANYADGKTFDSSWDRGGQPVDFPLNQVIPGFAQGIVGMKVGGRRQLIIPPDLGYGPNGNGPVGPNETLIFIIDLIAVS